MNSSTLALRNSLTCVVGHAELAAKLSGMVEIESRQIETHLGKVIRAAQAALNDLNNSDAHKGATIHHMNMGPHQVSAAL